MKTRAVPVVLGLAAAAGCTSARIWSVDRVVVSPCVPTQAVSGLLVHVVDGAGVPLSGVFVEARVHRASVAKGIADNTGSVTLNVTPSRPGYEVRAALPGFHPWLVKDVPVTAGCTTELRLPMPVKVRPPSPPPPSPRGSP